MTTKAIAAAFSKRISDELTAEELVEVIRRNGTPEYGNGACATHDFCDANVPMLEAFNEAMGREPWWPSDVGEGATEEESAADMRLWGEAWDIARANNFSMGGQS